MSKNYFIKHFQCARNLVLAISLLIIIYILIKFSMMSVARLHPLVMESSYLNNIFTVIMNFIESAQEKILLLTVILTLLFLTIVIIEIVKRVQSDSLMNLIKSVRSTLYLRRFLFKQNNNEDAINIISKKYNSSIKKLVVDVSNTQITVVLKVPLNTDSVDLLKSQFITIKEEIATSYNDYSFSSIERVNKYFILKGTKIL
ncbi:hypothetical protein G5S33_00863 [Staphylococcus cohnii subsp. cohnii]|nr:hypothetical protein [Staphylococcus cohnii subsp. barensis]